MGREVDAGSMAMTRERLLAAALLALAIVGPHALGPPAVAAQSTSEASPPLPAASAPVVWHLEAAQFGQLHNGRALAGSSDVIEIPSDDSGEVSAPPFVTSGQQAGLASQSVLHWARLASPQAAARRATPATPADDRAALLDDDGQALQLSSSFPDYERSLAALTAAAERALQASGAAADDPRRALVGEIRNGLAVAREQWDAAHNLARELRSADSRAEHLKEQLATRPVAAEAGPEPATHAAADAAAAAARQVLALRESQLAAQQAALAARPAQKIATEQEIETLRQRLAELRPSPAELPEPAEPEALHQLAARAARLAVRAQLLHCEIRSQHAEATLEVATLERDWSQRQVAEQRQQVALLERAAIRLRQAEIHRQVQAAESASARLPDAIRSVADHNASLIKLREQLLLKIEAGEAELRGHRESLETVRDNRRNLENKIQVAGMNHGIGLLMRQQIMQLPDRGSLWSRLRQIESELPPWQLLRFDYAEERDQLADVHAIAQQRLRQARGESGPPLPPDAEQQVTGLVQMSQQLTLEVLQDLDSYIDKLSNLNVTTQELLRESGEFQYFVEKHVLWIRSADPLSAADLQKTWDAGLQLADGIRPVLGRWGGMLSPARWFLAGLAGAAVVGLAWGIRFLLRQQLVRAADAAAQSRARQRAVTLRIVALSLVLASFWPALLYLAAHGLRVVGEGNPWAVHLASSLFAIVPFVWCGHVVRSFTLRGCFAELYFGWPRAAAAALHRMLTWYLWTVLPPRCVGMFFDRFQNEQWASSAGRTMFIVSQISLFLCLSYTLRQASPVLWGGGNEERTGTLWHRTRRVWPTLLIWLPLLLAVLSLIGYHYSASVLASRFSWTLWMILAAIGLLSLTKQVIALVLQQVSLRQARAERAAAQPVSGEGPPDEFDSVQVSNQLSRLLGSFTLVGVVVATYFLWAQVLPAVQILDRVELWSQRVQVAETIVAADGRPTVQMVARVEVVTLADAAWCVVILLLTLVLSRNLPGLLELTLLERLPLDRGGKYAISVVCRYLVAIAGLLLAGSVLGVHWTNVQWLVAAMSVGLGFGLQEIFGNFVSGIIILLERPVRMGDLVTVNGTTGWVTRVQLRATTITDFDRREMIVPNKKFITDDVVNWTLTDPITRLVIPVGIAYGSDTELACQTLRGIAAANRHVLADPEPTVVFTRFGASSLDLELRVFIPERQHVVEVQHELHMEIERRFREQRIEIAFPQQDIHIRTVPASLEAGELAGEVTRPRRAA